MFQRYLDEGLSQNSFMIGDERTGQAVVIDPRRDVDIYLAAARQHGLTLAAAIETHIHADFLSGARELAAEGVRVIAGPGSNLAFEHHEAADGEQLSAGAISLTFLHTPGHTPEHISVLSEERGVTTRLFSGDLLFVGGVGRPDLLGDAETRRLAEQLHASLFNRVLSLNDEVEVHPGHGSGSLCGAGIGKEPSSTIGRERRLNPMLQHRDRDEFVSAVLGDLPETPAYFARMKRINREGPPLLGLAAGRRALPAIKPAAAAALAADGALLIDLRAGDAFATGHPSGALSLAFGPKMGYWAGWIIQPDAPLLLLAGQPAHPQEAALQMSRVGLDRVEGFVAGGFDAWRAASLPTSAIEQISAAELRQRMAYDDPPHIVDVRTPKEWRAGHIDGSINIPIGDLPDRLSEIPREGVVATLCEGGYRSGLAASLLARHGISSLVNVSGGMSAYRALQAT